MLQTESGLDGLLTSRIENFDLIICGTDLPVVTGFELIRSIRTNSVNRDTPVILLSDNIDEGTERLAKALNVEFLLTHAEIADQLEEIAQECLDVMENQGLTQPVGRTRTN